MLDQMNGAVNDLIGAVNVEMTTANPTLAPADAQPRRGSALQANTRLWDSLFDQQDQMVHSRIDRVESTTLYSFPPSAPLSP